MLKHTRKEIPIMSQHTQELPRSADTVIVGGGSSGAVIAGRLAEQSDRFVLLLEAGPDYGSYQAGTWPQSLLDARTLPVGHDWNYASAARYGKPGLALPRGRVLGGCSAVNGCAAIWGHRADYDEWERQGNPGWSTQELLPFFHAAMQRMRVRTPGFQELTPWQQAFLTSAPGAGIPRVEDLNDLEQDTGVAASPVNISHGVRRNVWLTRTPLTLRHRQARRSARNGHCPGACPTWSGAEPARSSCYRSAVRRDTRSGSCNAGIWSIGGLALG